MAFQSKYAGLWAGYFLLAAHTLFAQLPAPRLTGVFPPGGRAGSTVEVTVGGQELDEATRLYFSQTNLAATAKLGTNGQPEANKFVVTIPAGTAPGVCEARLVGRFGISNPRTFVIGEAPELTAPPTNLTPAKAVELPLGTVFNGRVAANGQAWFKFTAKKGERVLVDCLTREIDSRMEDVLVLSDAGGRELEHSRRGGLLDFKAPADGEYRLKVHDFTFRGGDDYFFRLSASRRPHVDFIFPPAAMPGAKGNFTIYGRNLPGGVASTQVSAEGKPLEQLTVEIQAPGDAVARQRLATSDFIRPAEAALDGFEYRVKSPAGVSNPVRIVYATAPVTAAKLGVTGRTKPKKLTAPFEYAGQFRPRDPVAVEFAAKKGEGYWVEVFSQRLGFASDPFAVIERVTTNDKGEETTATVQEMYDADTNLGGTEFNTATRDPIYRLEVKEDGLYRVSLRDLFNRSAASPRHLFRLSVRTSAPDFRLVAMAVQPPKPAADARTAYPWTVNLRRRETQVIKVLAFRRDGFGGEIRLAVEGLPPDVQAGEAKIEAGKNVALIPLTAKEEAVAWSGALKVVGTAKVGESDVMREARGGSVLWQVPDFNNEAVMARMTRDVTVGVCEADKAAMTIEPVTNQVFEGVAGGKLQVPVKVNRHSEFLEALKLKVMGPGALDGIPDLDINNQTNSAVLEIDLAKYKLPAGTHTFFLQTQAKGKYRSYAADAQAAEGDMARADREASNAATAVKKATEALAGAKKAAEEAKVQAKSASEKDKETLEERVKNTAEALAAAEKALTEAEAKSKAATEKKTAVEAKAKEVKAKAAAKDASIMVYSAPITILVKEAGKK
jgi:hypothetical protein